MIPRSVLRGFIYSRHAPGGADAAPCLSELDGSLLGSPYMSISRCADSGMIESSELL
mgnify:CR=1 FL=1